MLHLLVISPPPVLVPARVGHVEHRLPQPVHLAHHVLDPVNEVLHLYVREVLLQELPEQVHEALQVPPPD